jgi:O-antigen/teichoic acid export membrane protein
MSGIKRIFKNFLSAWVSRGVKVITGLLIIPTFLHNLGKDAYGLIIVISSILAFSVFADLGIRASLVRYMVVSINKKNDRELNEYLNTASAMYFIISFILCTALYLSAGSLCNVFNVSLKYKETTILLLRTYGIASIFLSFVTPIFTAVTASQNRYDIANYRDTISGVLTSVALLVAVKYFHAGIVGWAIITITFQFLTTLSIIYIAFKLLPTIKFGIQYVNKSLVSPIIKFGSVVAIGGWSRMMKIDADPLILSSVYTPAEVALYRSGVSLPSQTRPLIAALCGQLYTVSTGVYAQDDNKKFKLLFEKGSKFTLLMGACSLLIFLILGPDFIHIWLKKSLQPQDFGKVILCMQAMALVDFCFYIEGSSYSILYAMNKLKFMTFTDIFLGLINISCSYFLAKYSHWGAPAVLLPTIFFEGLARPFYLFYTSKKINYLPGDVFRKILLPCFSVIGICLLFVLPISHYVCVYNDIINFIIKTALFGLVLLPSVWFIGLSKDDKGLLNNGLKK